MPADSVPEGPCPKCCGLHAEELDVRDDEAERAAGGDAAERTKLISISSPLPEYGASINQPWAQDHAALARADSLPS